MAKTRLVRIVYDSDVADLRKQRVELGKTTKEQKKLTGENKKFGEESKKTEKSAKSAFLNIRSALAGIGFAVIIKQISDITAEFEKMSAVLKNTLGSNSAAQKAMSDIVEFASVTPFAISQLTDGFVKLANQGFVPTTKELRKLGDLSSSLGKDFDQLVEAIIDAQVGEFERLKEFGIRSSKEGDKVTFTFKGVQTQTEFTEQAIRNYILSLGDLSGVSGSMAAISDTLGGKISNLGDNLDQLLLNIGNSTDAFKGAISTASSFIGTINKYLNVPLSTKLLEERSEVISLTEALIKNNEDQNVRSALITELNKKYPEFLKNIDTEKASTTELRDRLKEFNHELERKILLQIQEEQNAPLLEKLVNFRIQEAKILQRINDIEQGRISRFTTVLGEQVDELENANTFLNFYRIEQDKLTSQIAKNNAFYGELIKNLSESSDKTDDLTTKTEKLSGAFNKISNPETVKNIQQQREELEKIFEVLTGEKVENFSKKQGEDALKRLRDRVDEEFKIIQEGEEKKRKEYSLTAQQKEQIENQFKHSAITLLEGLLMSTVQTDDDILDSFENRKKREERLAGDNVEAQANAEIRLEKERKQIEAQRLRSEKEAALKTIAIQTAIAIARAFADYGWPAGIGVAGLAAAEGAAQAAIVQGFEKGGYTGDGHYKDTAGVVHKREFVVSHKQTAKSRKLLDDIQSEKLDDKTYQMLMGGKQQSIKHNIFDDSKIVDAIEKQTPPDFIKIGSDLYELKKKGSNTIQRVRKKLLN